MPNGILTRGTPVGKGVEFPNRPAKFSFVNGLWIARFYLLGTDDGAVGIFDTMPTKKAVQNNSAILESLTPFPVPLKDVHWTVPKNLPNGLLYTGLSIGTGWVSNGYGFEGRIPRIELAVGARPHNERE